MTEFSLDGGGESEILKGEFVSANYFDALGVAASRGRTFSAEEDSAPSPVAVISQDLWRSRFDSDPSILGRRISLNGLGFTVVGVTPEKFKGAEVGLERELWVPLSTQPLLYPPTARGAVEGAPDLLGARESHRLRVFGRLREGVSRGQAGAELASLARVVAETHYGRVNAETLRGVQLLQMTGGMDPSDREQALPVAGVVMGILALVLLIACANIAGLLLARGRPRARVHGG